MKYIFDFDNVLFHTKNQFWKHILSTLAKVGISAQAIDSYYNDNPQKHFSLKKLLADLSLDEKSYEEIMSKSNVFSNTELIELIKQLGKDNCYIVTFGNEEFQLEKILRTGIGPLFSEIIVVADSKKDPIERICLLNKNEKVLFIDDKEEHFKDLDLKKCPNLTTILYDNEGFSKLKSEIEKIS